jgi:hypothetical protein
MSPIFSPSKDPFSPSNAIKVSGVNPSYRLLQSIFHASFTVLLSSRFTVSIVATASVEFPRTWSVQSVVLRPSPIFLSFQLADTKQHAATGLMSRSIPFTPSVECSSSLQFVKSSLIIITELNLVFIHHHRRAPLPNWGSERSYIKRVPI